MPVCSTELEVEQSKIKARARNVSEYHLAH